MGVRYTKLLYSHWMRDVSTYMKINIENSNRVLKIANMNKNRKGRSVGEKSRTM